jgi:hypothetical protein
MHSLVNTAIFPPYQFLLFSCTTASDDLADCLPFNAARSPDRDIPGSPVLDWWDKSLKPSITTWLAILRLGKSQVSGEEKGKAGGTFTTID